MNFVIVSKTAKKLCHTFNRRARSGGVSLFQIGRRWEQKTIALPAAKVSKSQKLASLSNSQTISLLEITPFHLKLA